MGKDTIQTNILTKSVDCGNEHWLRIVSTCNFTTLTTR